MENVDHCFLIPFTLQHEEISSDQWSVHFNLFYILLSITGLLVNFIVLGLIAAHKKLRTKPFLFLMSISAADAFLPLYGALVVLDSRSVGAPLLDPSAARLLWSQWACWLESHLGLTLQSIIAFSLMVVSIERYVAICHPLQAKRWLTRTTCKITIFIIWILSIAIGFSRSIYTIPTCFRVCNEKLEMFELRTCAVDVKVVMWVKAIALFAVPSITMIIAYGRVIFVLQKSISETSNMLLMTPTEILAKKNALKSRRSTLYSITSTSTRTSCSNSSFVESKNNTVSFPMTIMKRRLSSNIEPDQPKFAAPVFQAEKLPEEEAANEANFNKASTTNAAETNSQISNTNSLMTKNRKIHNQDAGRKNKRRRVIIMLIITVAGFLICYGPNILLNLMSSLQKDDFGPEKEDFSDINSIGNFSLQNETLFDDVLFTRCDQLPPRRKIQNEEKPESEYLFHVVTEIARLMMLFHSTLNPILYFAFWRDFKSVAWIYLKPIGKACA